MNSESVLGEKTDHEQSEANEEKLHFPLTLDKEELNKADKNSHLLQDKKDTESLEVIQNYTERIKSFLGWESNPHVKQKFENPGYEAKIKTVDGNSSQNSINSYAANETDDERGKNPKENLSSFDETSQNKEVERRKFENEMNYFKSDKNVKILTDESINAAIEIKEENFSEDSDNDNISPKKEHIESDMENNNIDCSESKSNLLKKNTLTNDVTDLNNDPTDCSELDSLSLQSNFLENSNNSIPAEDLKKTESFPKRDIEDEKKFQIDSEANVCIDTQLELNKPVGSQLDGMNVLSAESKKEVKISKPTTQVLPCDQSSSDENQEIQQDQNDISETELKSMDGEKEELDSSRIYDLKTDAASMIPDLTSSNKSYSTSNENKDEDDLRSDDSVDLDEAFSSQVVDESQSEKNNSSESNRNDVANGISENNYQEDLISDDSIDLDEGFSFKDNLPKNHIKEIRRLSRDIVKDVIQLASSSVHEFYTKENLDTLQPENIKDYDFVKASQEYHFNNKILPGGECLEINTNIENKNFDCNSDYKCEKKNKKLDIDDEDIICGCGSFTPKWIQNYATPRAFLILFSIVGIIHGCYYTYVVAILTTLEKRYAFKTKVSGTLLLADEITPLILGIPVGYIGGRTHRPRMVGLGMCLLAVCCFISGLPYLIYGTSKHITYSDVKFNAGPKFCESGSQNSQNCNSDEQPPTLSVVGMFLFASLLKGFSTVTYYVIGMSYMDDTAKRKNSPLYFAIALALRLLGPLVGFLMSSGFLKYYENPVYDPGFGPDDPRWIGAWWIGFFLQGILLVIFTLPIALFPRRLPSQKRIEKVDAAASEDGMKEIFKGLISALKRLGKNPVFIVMIINTTMKIFGHFGHAIMLPKYMENQFRLSASEASLFSGAITIVCIIVSTITGGFLIWKFRPRIKVILAGMIVSETILSVGYLILMIPRCQVSEMSNFGMNEEGLILKSACNRNCDCSTSTFTPFCGPDSKTLYFSPCYAGCTEEIVSSLSPKLIKVFDNCSCVDQQEFGTTISEGFCPDENCRSQTIVYLVILFFLVTTSNLFTVAHTMILLRSVHPNDKSVALGTFETFICLFGFIPFPVVYGALVDSACLVWEKSCGETGNCWFYDMEKYNYSLHGASSLFCSLSVVCLTTLYFLSSRIRNLYDEEEEEVEEEKAKYTDIKLDTVSGSITKL